MTKSIIFIASLLAVVVGIAIAYPSREPHYCSLACVDDNDNKKEHVMCLFRTADPSPECENVIKSGLTEEGKQEILRVHNDLRQRVASGSETRGLNGPQPGSDRLASLKWNDELAVIAQRLANQCEGDHGCSKIEVDAEVGQNLAWVGSPSESFETSLESLIQQWYNEVDLFDRDEIQRFVFREETGHYSQLVWANTTEIGCGYINYNAFSEHYQEMMNQHYLVCNYNPSGNFPKQAVY